MPSALIEVKIKVMNEWVRRRGVAEEQDVGKPVHIIIVGIVPHQP